MQMGRKATPRWRRRSRLLLFAACALLVGIVAVPLTGKLRSVSNQDAPPPRKEHDIDAEWTVAAPADLGEVVYSQIVPGHILIAGTRGYAILDPGTGEKLWGEQFDRFYYESDEPDAAGRIARDRLRVTGDSLVVSGGPTREAGWWPVRVLALHTGEERFAATAGYGKKLRSVVTVESLVVEVCDADDRCTLSGRSWKDGARKWKREYRGAATLPVDVSAGAAAGDTVLGRYARGAEPVGSRALAILSSERDGKTRHELIELAEGERIRRWSDEREYLVAGPLLLKRTATTDTVIDPATGEPRHRLSRTDATDEATLVDEDHLVDVEPAEDFDGFRVVDLGSGETTFTAEADSGRVVGGELGVVVTLTDFDEDGQPRLHGLDVTTGKPRWTTRLYPKTGDMRGLQPEAVAVFDNHLALTGGPTSWTGSEFHSGQRTHVVDLADGTLRRVDDVTVQSLGHNSMLGITAAPKHAERPPKLVFYRL